MKTVGIVGGVASGKSQVARMFGQLGAEIIDADQAGHEVLDEPAVIQAATHRWGTGILGKDGKLDRRAIADRVFGPGNRDELLFWEGVTHPRIHDRISQRLADLAALPGDRVVVLEAALLFEAGWDTLCDLVVFIDAADSIRRQRAAVRRWSASEWEQREAAQTSLAEKRRKADIVIDNSGTLEQTYLQVQALWNQLS